LIIYLYNGIKIIMKRIYLVLLFAALLSSAMQAQLNGNGFYRLRNYGINNDYIKIVCDSINAQAIIGSASSVYKDDGEAAMTKVGYFLDNDIKTVKADIVFADPGTIFYLEKQTGSSTNYDLLSQGVGLKYISTCIFYGTSAGALPIPGLPATITNVGKDGLNNNLYTCYVNLKRTVKYLFFSKTINQTRFLGDTSNKLTIHAVDGNSPSNAPDNCKWYIEPVDLNDNYFAAAPVEYLTQNNKYYTTLRTAFSFTVPSTGSKVKVYKVTSIPTTEGELVGMEPIPTGEIVPAGLPVIIESTSALLVDNKLQPCTPVVKSEAKYNATEFNEVHSTQITVSNLTNSDVLYHGYGRHGHDVYLNNSEHTGTQWNGWLSLDDNLGFLASPYIDTTPSGKNRTVYTYQGTAPIYKLGIKDGAVGFWDLVQPKEVISGNEAYSPVQCQLFPVEKELGDIAESGAENITYEVVDSEHLYGVCVVGEKLYAKDYGKYRNPSVKAGDAIDGMKRFYDYNEPYDQSNWVVLDLDVEDPSEYVNKDLHVVGKLVNRANPEIKVSKIESKKAAISSYNLNTYSPASFMGTQASTVDGNTYFFVEPKPQEIVHIKWAVYGGNNKFYVEEPSSNANGPALKGGFVADDSFMEDGDMSDFQVGQVYEFDAVVKKNTTTSNISLKNTPYTGGGVSNNYVVYPFENVMVVTGTSKLLVEPKVTSVKYYNLMGVESDVPFSGVNIVVSTMSDGSRRSAKVVR